MPFENLTDRIRMSLRRLTGRGKLTEKDIKNLFLLFWHVL